MPDFTYITAFTVGLMGGVHCIGMCGGIVGALSFASQSSSDASILKRLPLLIAYNSGRLFSYTLAGGLMGSLGWLLAYWTDIRLLQQLLQLIAALFMLMLGLYISGWWMGLSRLEKTGAYLWRNIQPLAQKYLPVSSARSALMLGIFWGWLPCGLVYSVLVWSISAGGFVEGALLMLSFGLGTLPNLLAMGLAADQLRQWLQQTSVRWAAGTVVIVFALWQLAQFIRGL